MTHDDMRQHLRRWASSFPSRTEAAAEADVSPSYLADVLAGRKPGSDHLLRLVGLRKRRTWVYENR